MRRAQAPARQYAKMSFVSSIQTFLSVTRCAQRNQSSRLRHGSVRNPKCDYEMSDPLEPKFPWEWAEDSAGEPRLPAVLDVDPFAHLLSIHFLLKKSRTRAHTGKLGRVPACRHGLGCRASL